MSRPTRIITAARAALRSRGGQACANRAPTCAIGTEAIASASGAGKVDVADRPGEGVESGGHGEGIPHDAAEGRAEDHGRGGADGRPDGVPEDEGQEGDEHDPAPDAEQPREEPARDAEGEVPARRQHPLLAAGVARPPLHQELDGGSAEHEPEEELERTPRNPGREQGPCQRGERGRQPHPPHGVPADAPPAVVGPRARGGRRDHDREAGAERGAEGRLGVDAEQPERPELGRDHQEPAADAEEPGHDAHDGADQEEHGEVDEQRVRGGHPPKMRMSVRLALPVNRMVRYADGRPAPSLGSWPRTEPMDGEPAPAGSDAAGAAKRDRPRQRRRL